MVLSSSSWPNPKFDISPLTAVSHTTRYTLVAGRAIAAISAGKLSAAAAASAAFVASSGQSVPAFNPFPTVATLAVRGILAPVAARAPALAPAATVVAGNLAARLGGVYKVDDRSREVFQQLPAVIPHIYLRGFLFCFVWSTRWDIAR